MTQRSTGVRRVSSNYFSAFIACILENTALLAPEADDPDGQFDWQVSIADGATYLFDAENLLIQTEDGQVYPIGGFEESPEGGAQLRSMILTGFDMPENQPQT